MTMINSQDSQTMMMLDEDSENQLEFELAADLLSHTQTMTQPNQSVLIEKHELRKEIWGSYSTSDDSIHQKEFIEDTQNTFDFVESSDGSSSIESSLENSPTLQASAGQIQISLPAALCDETLIQEIQSIPDKMAFKIGDVADLVGIKQYVLRYWETEFDVLKPKKAANNQRMFTKKDVENVFLIRKLLHRDRFSIEGARAAMKDLKTFVRTEVKKEQVLHKYHDKIDSATLKLEALLQDIRSLKQKYR